MMILSISHGADNKGTDDVIGKTKRRAGDVKKHRKLRLSLVLKCLSVVMLIHQSVDYFRSLHYLVALFSLFKR